MKAAIVLLALLFLCACQVQEPAKVGVLIFKDAPGSVDFKNALTLFKTNSDHGLDIIFEETNSTKDFTTSFQKLVRFDNVKFVIAVGPERDVLVLSDMAEAEGVVLITPNIKTPQITNKGHFFFRTIPPQDDEAAWVAKYLRNLDLKEAVTVYDLEKFWSYEEIFANEFSKLGGIVLHGEAIQSSETNFSRRTQKLEFFRPDVYVLLMDDNQAVAFVSQFPSTDASLFAHINDKGIFTSLLEGKAEGVFSLDLVPYNQNFVNQYSDIFGSDPSEYSVSMYEALQVLDYSLAFSRSPTEVVQVLNKLDDFQGVGGKLTFSFDGDIQRDYLLKRAVNLDGSVKFVTID